jgi:hypothetical protein
MINLLTGKVHDATHPEPVPNKMVEDAWTAEAYLASMRRLLHAASKRNADTDRLLRAAAVLAEAAKVVRATPLPVKTSRVRGVPRDGDTP